MIAFIKQARSGGDSVGGVFECVVRPCPAGLGEPVFDKFEADLAKAMLGLLYGFLTFQDLHALLTRSRSHHPPARSCSRGS